MEAEAECNSPESQKRLLVLNAAVHEVKKSFVQHLHLLEWILDEEKLHRADRALTTTYDANVREPLFDEDFLRS